MHELAGPLSGTGMLSAFASVRGVDVASYQHPGGAAINWRQVARAGYKFASVKGTEGTYYINPYAARDVVAARRWGMYMTYYAFAIPNNGSGASQADYLLQHSHWRADGRMLPPELDIEYDPYSSNECYGISQRRMVDWIASFSNRIRRLTGELPIIYTTADWWNNCTGGNRWFGANPLWVAAYAAGRPPLPAGWRTWTYWQYTSSGTVPGIPAPGNTDLSYFNGAQVVLIHPGDQRTRAGGRVFLQVHSVNAAARETLRFSASGLPPGLAIGGEGYITGTTGTRTGVYRVTVTARSRWSAGSVAFNWQVTG